MLKKAGCERTFKDKINGAKSERPEVKEALDYLRDGEDVLVFHIFGALAEFERNLIRERTKAGIAAARARGKKGGRRRALDEKRAQRLYQLYDDTDTNGL
jgi:DNA invertase Pin-like site-specific DNA recombinase